MRFPLVLASVLLATLTSCTMWGDRPAHRFSEATGGENLERVFWQEMKARNWAEVSAHLAPNLLVVSPAGTMNRDQMLEHLKQVQLHDYSLGDFQVEWHGPTVVVSYTVTATGTAAGRPFPPEPVRRVSVWQKSKEHWLLIAHTLAGPLPPRPAP
jgi:ketosteroid isomerase-like protein